MTLASAPLRGAPMSPLGNMASDVQIKTFLCARFPKVKKKRKKKNLTISADMKNCSAAILCNCFSLFHSQIGEKRNLH